MVNKKLNRQFLQQYKSVFAEQLTARAYESATHLSGKDILAISPTKQLNLFIVKALFTAWQEEMKTLESPYFDYKDPDVRKAMTQFMNTLSMHIAVDAEHLKPLIESALIDTIELAYDTPAFLLREFDATNPSPRHAKQMIKYMVYFKQEVDQFFSELAESDDFETKVDESFGDISLGSNNLIQELSTVLILEETDLFEPLAPIAPPVEEEAANFFDQVGLEEEVEPEAEQEPLDIAKEEEPAIEEESEPEYEYSEKDAESKAEETNVEDELDDELAQNEIEGFETLDDLEEDNIEEEEESVEEPASDSPIVEVYKDEKTSEQTEAQEEPTFEDEPQEEYLESSEIETETVHQQYETETKTLADVHKERKINSVYEAISINHRYMFIQELFDGDADVFRSTIDEIENRESFDDAVEYLVQGSAKDYQWDMNSDEVKELLKVIFRRFR